MMAIALRVKGGFRLPVNPFYSIEHKPSTHFLDLN